MPTFRWLSSWLIDLEPFAANKQDLMDEIRRDKAIAHRLLIPFHEFHTWRDRLPTEYCEALVEVLLEEQTDPPDPRLV